MSEAATADRVLVFFGDSHKPRQIKSQEHSGVIEKKHKNNNTQPTFERCCDDCLILRDAPLCSEVTASLRIEIISSQFVRVIQVCWSFCLQQ